MRLALRLIRYALKAAFSILFIAAAILSYLALPNDRESVCYGTANGGRLENAKRLPFSGENFQAYWLPGWLLGRTNMHGKVRDVTNAAYRRLATSRPDLVFVYGEASWPWGGRFWPHRTHRDGLSVDFVVPVRDGRGQPVSFPRSMWTGGFYAVDMDNEGRFAGGWIDFEAMAAHLTALQRAAAASGIGIRRVIFDPDLQKKLHATPAAPALAEQITFSRNRSWFRHDAHYHVDFDLPCRPG